jgi:glycolate dehydrogenase iron-sulfur subunit
VDVMTASPPAHATSPGPLALDEDDLARCVQCGLCLPHCPTWRVTGDESASPRGRIAAMRAVQAGTVTIDADFVASMDGCVQCRGCETACPSFVPFGRLMEATRETLTREHAYVPWWQRVGYRFLARHRALLVFSRLLAVAQRLRLVSRRLGLPRLPVHAAPLRATGDDVWLFTGCVMDAWQRDVHAAAIRVLGRAGAGVALPDPKLAGCCGALALHAGLVDDARVLAARVVRAFPGDAPVLVDSAGCGAALKDYGHLLGTEEGARFATRVRDVHEWLAEHADDLPIATGHRARVALHDACHLRHVQRASPSVRTVLTRYADVVELDDEGLCCGAGGAYATLHPDLGAAIRARKLDAISRTGAAIVASANPGCSFHLAAAGVDVRHPLEIVDAASGNGA